MSRFNLIFVNLNMIQGPANYALHQLFLVLIVFVIFSTTHDRQVTQRKT